MLPLMADPVPFTLTLRFTVEPGPHDSMQIARRRALRAAGLAVGFLSRCSHVQTVAAAQVEEPSRITPLRGSE